MVFEILSLIVGLGGFALAGWKDLKTTEFPDWIPYSLIIAALAIRAGVSFLIGEYVLLTQSLLIGALFLGFGLLLYHAKQWGDGDAWLLGAMGFLYPDGIGFPPTILPFPLTLLFNFFFVSFFYILLYSLVIGIKSKKIKSFVPRLRKNIPRIIAVTVIFTIALTAVVYFSSIPLERFSIIFLFSPVLFCLLVFLQYGRFIEEMMFKKKIDVLQLREGDVPIGEKWRVLGKKEIQALRKRGGKIWIKEGVRFAPVFFLTVIAMLIAGNIYRLFLPLFGI